MSSSSGWSCGNHYFELLVFWPPFVTLLLVLAVKTLMNSSTQWIVGEPIAESRVVGEPIVAWKNVLLHFSPQNVWVHFGITSSGRTYRWITSSGRTYRSLQKRFSVSVVVQTETVFSFLQGWQRTAKTVFSFRRCTDGNGFQYPEISAENGGNGFQFPNDISAKLAGSRWIHLILLIVEFI